jgi:hypothetical protein
MTTPYYRPSGRVPASVYPIAIVISAGLVPFAWLYAWLIIHAPPVFNFFIAFGFSFAIGWLTKLIAARGKVRDLSWIGRAGIVLGVAGWYLQWAAWAALTMYALGRQESAVSVSGTFVTLATHPWLLIRFAMDIVAGGTMSLFGWPLRGAWLLGVWLIELGLHLMVAPSQGRMRVDEPFCETTNTWAEKVVVQRKFSPVDAAQVSSALEADPHAIRTILTPSAADEAMNHAEVILYRTGAADAYLSITNVVVTLDKKGAPESKREPVVEYLRLPDTNIDTLIDHLAAMTPSTSGHTQEAGRPVAPAIAGALEYLEAERYAEALDAAVGHVSAEESGLRTDALRISALACARLERWDEAARFFSSLFREEPGTHNALQAATSSVMAGALSPGLSWMEQAQALNAASKELPHMMLLTSFVTALKQSGQEAAAMPFIDQLRQAYTDLGSTDPTVLYASSMPFFSTFLSNSLQFVRAAFEPEQGRRWYAHMLPSLDPAGRAELSEWLEREFGPVAGQA